MTKNTKLVWRLGKLPSPSEVTELVKDKIITNEEAREILFNSETEEKRDIDSFKSEIKFLRELVDKLAKNKSQVVETIRQVEVPYYKYTWVQPYQIWCGSSTTDGTGNSYTITTTGGTGQMYLSASNSLSDINTFT